MTDGQAFSTDLQKSIPAVRLNSFRASPQEDIGETLSRYARNVELCEAMYPSLHYFEIGLRNNIDSALIARTRRKTWYDPNIILASWEQEDVEKAMNKIIERGKMASRDRVIAELSLGFWVNLFSDRYEEKLWHNGESIKIVFPNMPKSLRKAKTIGKDLECI